MASKMMTALEQQMLDWYEKSLTVEDWVYRSYCEREYNRFRDLVGHAKADKIIKEFGTKK